MIVKPPRKKNMNVTINITNQDGSCHSLERKDRGPTFATQGALGFTGRSLTGSPTWSSGNSFALLS